MNVLVADDDPVVRSVLAQALKGPGRRILLAEDGEQALDLYCREKVRIVFSDWRMPRLDGLDLCRRLRGLSLGDYTYFVLITATAVGAADWEQAMSAEVDDFLVLPVDAVQVRLRLRAAQRLLGYANRLHELESVIPICSYCRRLRDDQDAYHQMETYFGRHAGVLFSHGICPECYAHQLAQASEPV